MKKEYNSPSAEVLELGSMSQLIMGVNFLFLHSLENSILGEENGGGGLDSL